jgi:hypothetical protein
MKGTLRYSNEYLEERVYRGYKNRENTKETPQSLAKRWSQDGKLGDEEYHNIVGSYKSGYEIGFDPVCCNVFDMYEAEKERRQIAHRLYHSGYEESYKKGDDGLKDSDIETITKKYEEFLDRSPEEQ